MKIKINSKKCKEADKCMKCLQVCFPGVFLLHPKKKFKTDLESQLKIKSLEYEVSPRFIDSCTLCMKCVESCPHDAIKIKT